MWASNLSLESRTAAVQLKAWDIITGEEIFFKHIQPTLTLIPNCSTEITEFEVPVSGNYVDEELRIVVAAYLIENGQQIARYVNWPDPLKYVHLQRPESLSVRLSKEADVVEITSDVPVKGVALQSADEAVKWANNCVDIVPGETFEIGVTGLRRENEKQIAVRYLGL